MQSNALLIANRFNIQDIQSDRLGQGAMGDVYRGIDLETGETVAIKVLKPDLVANDPELVERFNRECQALRQLNHPNIVKMLAAVTEKNPATGAEVQFLVMEYVSGGSLQDILNQQPRLPVQRVLQIGLELADALSRAHHLNIIHRDLKPANVLLAQDGTPRLSDFGIAHFSDRPRLTQTGALIGSVGYLSPEVCNLQKPDARADIWAFGVMLFEMLAGEHPFIEDGITATLINILKKPTPDLTNYRSDIPAALIELIYQMLEKDLTQRTTSTRLVAARLEAILQNQAIRGLPMEKAESTKAALPTPARPEAALVDSVVRRNQLLLLEKVKSFWIKGVLEQCVPQGALIDVQKQRADSTIEHPWGKVLEASAYQDQDAPAKKSTLETFIASDRSLLILGDPGSGKTVTLLTLARELARLAENDTAQPIPVILKLVSWTNKRSDLVSWIVEELTVKYQIPRKMGRDWLEDNSLLLLLDGLDEIPSRHLQESIITINRFRETNGLTGLIVCSRTEAYESAGVHLKLGGAIRLQPLSREQIDGYLASGGSGLAVLRTALQNDAELQRIAQSPLWLNLMSITYRDIDSSSDSGLIQGESVADSKIRRQRLVQAYVQRAFQHRIGKPPYENQQTNHWLAWLAGKLLAHNQAVFLIEQMQPNWLPTAGWRLGYMLVTGVVKGFWVGVVVWLLLQAFNREFAISDNMPGVHIFQNFPIVIALHLIMGVLFGLGHALLYEQRGPERVFGAGSKEALIRALLTSAALFSVASLLLVLMGENYIIALFGSLWSGAFFLLLTANTGDNYHTAIRTVEALSWSWREAFKQTLTGLGVGTAFTLISLPNFAPLGSPEVLLLLLRQWLMNIAPWVLMLFVMGGLGGKRVEKRSQVNQGIWLSARNAGFAGLLSTSVLSVFFLAFGKYYAVSNRLALQMGLVIGLVVVLLYGGNVIDHFILRLMLCMKGYLPRNLVRFLDHAAELNLLRKVGGGYIFPSRLLQDFYTAFR